MDYIQQSVKPPPVFQLDTYYLRPRIVRLESLRIASLNRSEKPVTEPWERLLEWARDYRLANYGPISPRFFGINTSPATLRENFEKFMTVGPDAQSDEVVTIRDFPGGLYAVTRADDTESSLALWQKLRSWLSRSNYQPSNRSCLEEHIVFIGLSPHEYELDLYLPIEHKAN